MLVIGRHVSRVLPGKGEEGLGEGVEGDDEEGIFEV